MSNEKRLGISVWLACIAIVSLSAFFRLAYNVNTLIVEPVRADAAYNLIYANNILEDGTFSKDLGENPVPDSFWAPGFPVFLAAMIYLSEASDFDTYTAILLSQVVLGTATVLLSFLIAASFLPGYWSLLPPLLCALSPHLISMGSYILTETLFGFMLLLALYALVKACDASKAVPWFLAGLAFAGAYLVNPISLFLPVILIITIYLWNRRSPAYRDPTIKRSYAMVLLIPIFFVFVFWSARSFISVPPEQQTVSDRLITNLIIGLYPDYHEKWKSSILEPEKKIVLPGTGVEQSYLGFYREFVNRLSEKPLELARWYALNKPKLLWDWDIRTGFGEIYIYRVEYSLFHTSTLALFVYVIMASLHPFILLSSLFGLVFIFRQGANSALAPTLIYVTMIYVSLVYVLTQSEPRYSIPLRPELYLCFAYSLQQVCNHLLYMRRRPA